jgi:hypothetical protein
VVLLQALVAALYQRFGQEDHRFKFADIATLTGDSGELNNTHTAALLVAWHCR